MAQRESGTGGLEISGYHHISQIGRGASSVVYKGFDPELARWVAIKVLLTDNPNDPARRRFKREGEITANLGKHPHIVQVLGTGFTSDHCPYVVMEYFEEGSIGDRLRARGAFGVMETVDIGEKIADAVAAAHKAGILHCDIKPQNILLSEYGPALADFGIARTATNLDWSLSLDQLTPMHSPPETLSGGTSTAQSDIYSLGSTLYTMLAGRAPFAGFTGESPLGYQLRVMQDPVPPIPRADLSPDLLEVLDRALAKNPADRFESAVQFRDALRRVHHATTQTGLDALAPDTDETHFDLAPPHRADTTPLEDPITRSRDVDVPSLDPPTQTPVIAGIVSRPDFEVQTAEPTFAPSQLGTEQVGAFITVQPDPAMVAPQFEVPGAPQEDEMDEGELTRIRSRAGFGLADKSAPREITSHRPALRVVVVVAMLILLVAIGLGVSSVLGKGPTRSKHGASSPPAVENNGRDKPTIGQLQDNGTSETLNWVDSTAAHDQFLVAVNGGGLSHSYSTPAGATSYTFSGLSPTIDYCFSVAAYEGETPAHVLVHGAPTTTCQTSRS